MLSVKTYRTKTHQENRPTYVLVQYVFLLDEADYIVIVLESNGGVILIVLTFFETDNTCCVKGQPDRFLYFYCI